MKKSVATFTPNVLSAAIFTAFVIPNVSAEDGAVGIEEIVVTARHREESLQDVPGQITAFTETSIERSGIERAEDFVMMTPGVMLIDAAEVGDTQLSIRGINGARDAEPNFAFILDGILHTNPSAFNREFAGLQQIEILKGPQGALYGRNASAGAVIVSTKKPTQETTGELKVSVGQEDTRFFSGAVSGALIQDELYGRLQADFKETDGFYKNSFLDKKIVDDYEGKNINGRLIWEPSEELSFDLRAHFGKVEAAAISYNANFANQDVNDQKYVFHPNEDPQNEQRTKEFSLKLDYEMDWATLTAWTLYSDMEQWFLSDGTSGGFSQFASEPGCLATTAALNGYTPLEVPFYIGALPTFPDSILPPYSPTTCDGFQYQERNQKDLSFEVRLTSSADEQLRWSVGAYYLELDREVAVALQQDLGQGSTLQPFSPAGSISPTEQLVWDQFDTTVYAIFAQVGYDITSDIELSLALRYDREEREVESKVPANALTEFLDYNNDGLYLGGAPLNPAFDPVINPAGVSDRDEAFTQLQPKFSITWDVNNEWTLYADYGLGFKSGGFNNQGSAAITDIFVNGSFWVDLVNGGAPAVIVEDEFDKEVSKSFEIGFKSRLWDERISLEGAIYHTEVEDLQFMEFIVGPHGLLRVVTNIDDVEIDGLELAANMLLTDNWSIDFGYSVIDTEIKKNSSRPITEGNKSPSAPEYTFNLGTTYTHSLTDSIDLTARVDWSVVGPMWFHTVQDESVPNQFFSTLDFSPSERDTFDTLNVRVALEAENWTVAIMGKNIGDEEYPEEVIPAPEFGGSFLQPGTESLWSIEAIYKF